MANDYFINDDGVLCRVDDCNKQPNPAGLVVLPPKYRPFFLKQYHDRSGHMGVRITCDLIRQRFYRGGISIMRASVREHIKHCQACH